MISNLDDKAPPVKNLQSIIIKRLRIFGIVISALSHKYENEFYETVPRMIAQGKIKYKEDVTEGLEFVGEALLSVLTGKNKGTAIVSVARE